MKKKILREFILIGIFSLMLSGCNFSKSEAKNQFGDFSYNGNFLKEYAVKQINVDEAKDLIYLEDNQIKLTNYNEMVIDKENLSSTIKTILTKYASVEIVVKYYVSGTEEQQVRKDLYQGTDFLYMLTQNDYTPFGQMSTKHIYVNDGLLDSMEEENKNYKNDYRNMTSPFNEPYTYHTSETNELIIQSHYFAELPASTQGGIGSTFRQDCESIMDSEGKIRYWQSSLGIYTSTPTGTVKQGYIFEAEFSWIEK